MLLPYRGVTARVLPLRGRQEHTTGSQLLTKAGHTEGKGRTQKERGLEWAHGVNKWGLGHHNVTST